MESVGWSMKYKLVRDKIPTIIVESGQMPEFYVAEDLEYERRLLDKMIEELEEFRENPCIEEAADMCEVFSAICDQWGLGATDVIETATRKAEVRGRFTRRFILKIRDPEEEKDNDWNCSPYGESLWGYFDG